MKSTVIIYRDLLKQLSTPMLYLSAFGVLSLLITSGEIKDGVCILTSVFFPFYIVFSDTKNTQKGIIAAFCTVSSDIVYYSFSGHFFSILFSVILGVISLKIIKDMRLSFAIVSLFVSFVLFAFAAGLAYPLLSEYLKAFASLLTERGYAFGSVKNLFDLAVSDSLSDFFYHTSFAKTVVAGGKAVSGAVDIFKENAVADVISQYLTGQYFVSIFITIGLIFSICKSLNENEKYALIAVSVCAVISGDVRLFSLFILLYNPLIYIAYLFIIAGAYLISALLKLSVGFENAPSLVELIKNGNSWGYFLITGFVLSLTAYFLSRLIISKFNLSHGSYYPKDVRIIVSMLGGARNIQKAENGKIFVRNPNLVNILMLDCNIKGNNVLLNEDEYELIKEYF